MPGSRPFTGNDTDVIAILSGADLGYAAPSSDLAPDLAIETSPQQPRFSRTARPSSNRSSKVPDVRIPRPEIEAVMVAAREIEKDYLAERDRAKQLAEQIRLLQGQEKIQNQGASEQLRAECEQLRGEVHSLRDSLRELKAAIPDSSEIQTLQEANQRLFERYLNESKKVQKLEVHLETNEHVKQARQEVDQERKRFRQTAAELYSEVERLRSIFPIKALLSAKEKELQTVEQALRRIPARHPDRKTIESLAHGHREERDHLALLVQKAEETYEKQLRKIQEATRS